MSISAERVKQDLRKLEELSNTLHGRISIKETSGNPVNKIILQIKYPTAPSSDFPQKIQQFTDVRIELLSRYPFQEPVATILTPVFHPNVYSSGKICFGTKWLPTQGLDLLVRRIVQIITFDQSILNANSPANGQALSWYKSAIVKHPESFPTDKLIIKEPPKKGMSWNNVVDTDEQKTVIQCPNCKASLRVPSGRKLNVSCSKCSTKFLANT